jgi:hypothetical protein
MTHERFEECIEACNRCAAECEHCASACLKEDNVKMMTRCIELDMDCSLLCVVTSKLLARGSEEGFHIAQHCAEVCRKCAEECRKHDVEHCQQCADACEDCADECEKVTQPAAVGK